jgi:hypothetical protein
MEPSDDISCSLGDIQAHLSAPISSTLLEIQKYQFSKGKSIEWISNLECLSIPPKVGQKRPYGDDREFVEVEPPKRALGRCKVNPFKNRKQRNYVAVSWVWKPEPGEELAFGSYLIESGKGGQQLPSDVRDIALEE